MEYTLCGSCRHYVCYWCAPVDTLRPCNLDRNHRSGNCLPHSKHDYVDPKNGEEDALRLQQQKGPLEIRRGGEFSAPKHEQARTRSRKRKRSIREKREDMGSSDAS